MKVFWAWGHYADGMRWSSTVAAVVVAALLTPAVHAPPARAQDTASRAHRILATAVSG